MTFDEHDPHSADDKHIPDSSNQQDQSDKENDKKSTQTGAIGAMARFKHSLEMYQKYLSNEIEKISQPVNEIRKIIGYDPLPEPDLAETQEAGAALLPNETKVSTSATTEAPRRNRGMSDKRKNRAHIFKNIKEKNPQLSYLQVAMHANRHHRSDLDRDVYDYDVRNDFRDMNWEWQRADRIR